MNDPKPLPKPKATKPRMVELPLEGDLEDLPDTKHLHSQEAATDFMDPMKARDDSTIDDQEQDNV